MTTAQVKNIIRRGFRELVDPDIDQDAKTAIWAHFGARCAYCEGRLSRKNRQGQMDHLISASRGGSNHGSNRVLSCGSCNGDEKRDQEWREFLRVKSSDDLTFARRLARIEAWIGASGTRATRGALLAEATRQADAVCSAFDDACAIVRQRIRASD